MVSISELGTKCGLGVGDTRTGRDAGPTRKERPFQRVVRGVIRNGLVNRVARASLPAVLTLRHDSLRLASIMESHMVAFIYKKLNPVLKYIN